MDIGKNFTFITEDEAWMKKLGICAALHIPIVNLVGTFVFWGYLKKMFRNVQEGYERPLPEWDDFVAYLVEGLKAVVVVIGYMLPAIILYIVSFALSFAGGMSDNSALRIASMACGCVSLLVIIAINLLLNVGLMRFFATDSLGEAFNFGEIIGFIKGNIGQYLLALVMMFVTMFGAVIVGLIACGIGVLVTVPYGMLVSWKNFADVYRNAQQAAASM